MADTYTVAGTSIKKGVKTNRFANGTAASRAKVLEKDNHTEIMLFDLPTPMSKEDALAWLATNSDAVPVDPKAVTPKEPKAAVVKTSKGPSTFRVPPASPAVSTLYSAEEIATSPIARAVHEAGNSEIKLSAEQEVEAMALHKESVIDFMAWTQVSVQVRNEFRAMVLHCPKKKVA